MRKQLHKYKQSLAIRNLKQQFSITTNPMIHYKPQIAIYLNQFTQQHNKSLFIDKIKNDILIDSPTKLYNTFFKSKKEIRSPKKDRQIHKKQNINNCNPKVLDLSINISQLKTNHDHQDFLRRLDDRKHSLQIKQERNLVDRIKFLREVEDKYVGYEDGTGYDRQILDEVEEQQTSVECLKNATKMRQLRSEMQLKLKQKIKSKQSRKHIYNVLRVKSQARQKIRTKTYHHIQSKNNSKIIYNINPIQIISPEKVISQQNNPESLNKTCNRLYYGQLNLKLKNIFNSKNKTTPPILENTKNHKDLIIQTKPYFQTSTHFQLNKLRQNSKIIAMINDQSISTAKKIRKPSYNCLSKQNITMNKGRHSKNSKVNFNSLDSQFSMLTPWGQEDY